MATMWSRRGGYGGYQNKRSYAGPTPAAKRFKPYGFKSVGPLNTLRRFNRRYVPGPSTTGTLTQQVKALQKVVKQILPEFKEFNIDLAQTNISTSGVIQCVTGVAQGVTEVTRVGEDYTLRGLNIRGYFNGYSTLLSTTAPLYYRVYLIQDLQQINDTVPAVNDIFNSADPVLALPNPSFMNRFRFLYTSPLKSNNTMAVGTALPSIDFSWFGTSKIGFNGAGSTDLQKNHIYVVWLTSDATVDFTGNVRVQFTDT